MSKQFVKGNVYVFSKKKFLARQNEKKFKYPKTELRWVNRANGHQVAVSNKFGGYANGFGVSPEWCKCISNKAKPRTKPLSVDEIRELDEKLCEYCKCTFYGLEMGAQHISAYSSGCEGAYCEEAYEYYLDNFEEDED